jgi:RNA recognition motif-containing protein
VELADDDKRTRAIDALQGAELTGRPLRINKAEPRSNAGSSGRRWRQAAAATAAPGATPVVVATAVAVVMGVAVVTATAPLIEPLTDRGDRGSGAQGSGRPQLRRWRRCLRGRSQPPVRSSGGADD